MLSFIKKFAYKVCLWPLNFPSVISILRMAVPKSMPEKSLP